MDKRETGKPLMGSTDQRERSLEAEAAKSHSPYSSFSDYWKDRILVPTILAGFVGAGVGLVSKHRKVHGGANICATYATNFSIVTGCYCGAREFVRVTRKTGPDDLLNSAIAGFGSGALLGRLQGGQLGAIRYSVLFAIAGTTADFAMIKLKHGWDSYRESVFGIKGESQKNGSLLKLPEWFPIQILDDEAIAAKQAREQELLAQRARIRELRNEDHSHITNPET